MTLKETNVFLFRSFTFNYMKQMQMSWLPKCFPLYYILFYMKFSLGSYHLFFVPEASEAQAHVEHGDGVQRAAGKLQRLRREKPKNYLLVFLKGKKNFLGSIKTQRVPLSITDLLLGSTVQDHRRPDNAVVSLVKKAILRTVEVSQDKDRLKVCVVLVCKLLNTVSGDTHGRVDVLQGGGSRKHRRINILKKKMVHIYTHNCCYY